MDDEDGAGGSDAPPLPRLRAPWAIRLSAAGGVDLARVHAWMHRPHVAPRWGQAWSREDWRSELAGQLAGRHSRPCLVAHAGRTVAYVEIYRVAHDALAEHTDLGPHDLGVHVAIGDSRDTGRGLGGELLGVLGRGLLAADPRCRRVVLEPDVGNEAIRRALRRVGYRSLGPVELPHKTADLMALERV